MPTLELFSHRLASESMFPKKAEQRIRVTLELFKAHAQDQYLVSEVLLIPISLFRALADVDGEDLSPQDLTWGIRCDHEKDSCYRI